MVNAVVNLKFFRKAEPEKYPRPAMLLRAREVLVLHRPTISYDEPGPRQTLAACVRRVGGGQCQMAGSRDISQFETGTLFIEDIKLCFLFSCRSREAIPSKPFFSQVGFDVAQERAI